MSSREYLGKPRAGFNCACPILAVKRALIRGLRERYRLEPRIGAAEDCIIQWAPFSKINWQPALAGRRVVSAYLSRGIANKSRLIDALALFVASDNESVDIAVRVSVKNMVLKHWVLDEASIQDLIAEKHSAWQSMQEEPGQCWVLKGSKANNATQIAFISSSMQQHTLNSCLQEMLAGDPDSASREEEKIPRTWLLQSYVANPLLVQGRKFHLRVNVLAVGRLSIFVHEDCVLHVACEPFTCGDWSKSFIHVTNHCLQSKHPEYRAQRNILSLEQLQKVLLTQDSVPAGAEKCADTIRANAMQAVSAIFRAITRKTISDSDSSTEAGGIFLPMLDSFELFGFDFIVCADNQYSLKLLEINSGPALEGHESMKRCDSCDSLVQDALDVVLSEWPVFREESKTQSDIVMPREHGGFRLALRMFQGAMLSDNFKEYLRSFTCFDLKKEGSP